jgi:hypothetical protein
MRTVCGLAIMGILLCAVPAAAAAIDWAPFDQAPGKPEADRVMPAGEVNPVLAALSEGGIEVTALHNHMLDDEPRTFFVHFWANDDAVRLAHAVRNALDKLQLAKGWP